MDLEGMRVLIRADFNVPLNKQGQITDDSRIVKSLPTIRFALEKRAKVILISHLGRPEGRRSKKYSLRPVAARLSELLNQKVGFEENCVGRRAEERGLCLCNGEAVLLENLRFHPGEEKNDAKFAQALARLADVYINDAFGTAHRAHASTEAIARTLPAAAGLLLAREIEYFDKVLKEPSYPFVAILGGAKVSDKIHVIGNLLGKINAILIGGAMAYPFCRVEGHSIGNSKYETGAEVLARQIKDNAQEKGVALLLPVDHVVTQKLEKPETSRVVDEEIPEGWMGVDIGPRTVEVFKSVLAGARTVLWNGPLGVFETPPFERGSLEIAKCLADLKATTIIGGGDTAAAIHQFGLEERMSHVSTGGGASLEYLEGKLLPGIAVLPESENAIRVEGA